MTKPEKILRMQNPKTGIHACVVLSEDASEEEIKYAIELMRKKLYE